MTIENREINQNLCQFISKKEEKKQDDEMSSS